MAKKHKNDRINKNLEDAQKEFHADVKKKEHTFNDVRSKNTSIPSTTADMSKSKEKPSISNTVKHKDAIKSSEIENIEFTDANRAEDFTDDITDSEIAVEDSVSSADAVASGKVIKKGKCGDNLTCTIVENASNRYTLIIDGNGNMYDYLMDYNTSQRPWHQYRQKINTVIMKEGVS